MAKRLVVLALIGALGWAGGLAAQGQSAQSMLDAARKVEVVDGKLDQAIAQYQTIVEKYRKTDPAAAATALLRIAECYQKIGDVQATRTFEQLVREFANQPQAAVARVRLAELRGRTPSTAAPKTIWAATTSGPTPYSLSESGRYLLICDWGDNANLVLRDMTTGIDRQITNLAGSNLLPASFFNSGTLSADDQQIAFAVFSAAADAYELRLANLRGTGQPPSRSLLDSIKPRYVDPVAFTGDGQGLIVVLQRTRQDSPELGRVALSDGSFTRLKTLDAFLAGAMNRAYVSPDRTLVAYDAPTASSTARDVFVMTLDGQREFAVVQNRADDRLAGWSPDGTRILFVSDRGGVTSLWSQQIKNDAPAGNPQIVRSDIGRNEVLGVSPGGSIYMVTYNGRDTSFDVKSWSVDFRTGRLLSGPADIAQEYSTGSNRFPRWSPDGASLAYLVVPPVAKPDATVRIVIRASDTNRIKAELALPLNNVANFSWLADGSGFLVSGQDAKGVQGTWRVDATKGTLTALVTGRNGMPGRNDTVVVALSRDANTIYLRRMVAGVRTLVERNVTTGAERTVFEFASPETFRLSADLQTLYRRVMVPGGAAPFDHAALVARDLSTGVERELMRRNFGGIESSPDGSWIAAVGNDEAKKTRSIVIVPTSGGPAREIMPIPLRTGLKGDLLGGGLAFIAWAPDSRSMLVRKVTTTAAFAAEEGAAEFWWAPLDGAAPQKLIDAKLPNDTQMPGLMSVHPDGRIVMEVRRSDPAKPAEVWVLEGALPSKK
jgi:hypothetical protein